MARDASSQHRDFEGTGQTKYGTWQLVQGGIVCVCVFLFVVLVLVAQDGTENEEEKPTIDSVNTKY